MGIFWNPILIREIGQFGPELTGCVSAGETEQRALETIREAIALYLENDPVEFEPGAIVREVFV